MTSDRGHAFVDADNDLGMRGLVVFDGWLGLRHATALRSELLTLLDGGAFAPSRIGRHAGRQNHDDIRTDRVCWFDESAPVEGKDGRGGVHPGPEVARLLVRLDELRCQLNETSFLSLVDVECHAACYEAGAFYKPHLDAFDGDSRRVVTFCLYLNPGWVDCDGGCLGVQDPPPRNIAPVFNRLVLFQSRTVLHEVQPVNRQRLSCTGWMSAADPVLR
jgi:SM-20-related protein